MPTDYPGSLDNFPNPSPTTFTNSGGDLSHAEQHTNANDAIEALQVVVGTTGSADVNSLTYKVNSFQAGAVNTDAIWDAVGDLVVGSGANTAVRLPRGSANQFLRTNAAGTNLEWDTIVPSDIGAATAVHTHAATDITSGLLPLARGGLNTDVSGFATASFIRKTASGFEARTAGQVLSDIGAAASGHTHTATGITDFSEAVDDRIGSLLVAGSNISLNYNDVANTLTITASVAGLVTSDSVWDAAGDLVVGSGADTAVKLPRGSANQFLRVNAAGTNLEWNTTTAADIGAAAASHTHAATDITSGTMALARGGLNVDASAFTTNNYIRKAASAFEQRTPAQVLSDIGAAASVHTHDASSQLTNLVPLANGGTNVNSSSWTTNNYVRKSASAFEERTPAQVRADIGADVAGNIVSGQLALARGGTNTDMSGFSATNYLRLTGSGVEQRTPSQVLGDINAAAANHTHAFIINETHHYAVSGDGSNTTIFSPHAVSVGAGETLTLVSATHRCSGGTPNFKLQKNGVDITGYTSMSITTSKNTTTASSAMTTLDEITPVCNSGAWTGWLYITLTFTRAKTIV